MSLSPAETSKKVEKLLKKTRSGPEDSVTKDVENLALFDFLMMCRPYLVDHRGPGGLPNMFEKLLKQMVRILEDSVAKDVDNFALCEDVSSEAMASAPRGGAARGVCMGTFAPRLWGCLRRFACFGSPDLCAFRADREDVTRYSDIFKIF